ncbi:hypothetical protein BDZ91DRAFT_758201 [Kalaharituber pfeilii]|nr:hypothetical protein BDZ91DRAFT_758201 [Kalaharituber pfeilii]
MRHPALGGGCQKVAIRRQELQLDRQVQQLSERHSKEEVLDGLFGAKVAEFIARSKSLLVIIITGLGGIVIVIWNERLGCADVKSDFKEKIGALKQQLGDKFDNAVDGIKNV